MELKELDKPVTAEIRQKLYKFLVVRPDALKLLLRNLTEAEACEIIGCLANADDRRQGKPTKAQRRQDDAEIDAILVS